MRSARCIASLATGLLALAMAPRALANGRFPESQSVVVGPGAAADRIVLRATFGFLVSDDAGATFHWICEAALGFGGPYDAAFALDGAGGIEFGLPGGITHATPDGCTYTADPNVTVPIDDLDEDPTGEIIVASSNATAATTPNRVFRSDDGAATFTALGAGVMGVQITSVALAPSNSQRVYATGSNVDSGAVTLYRSDDGGATLSTLATAPFASTAVGAYIAGVDPVDADTVFVRAVLPAMMAVGGEPVSPTALERSTDGGATWTSVLQTDGPMLGFAISDDEQTVWAGGTTPGVGLMRSDDGGLTWNRTSDVHVNCLRFHAGVLYVCGETALDHFALGRSTDLGITIQPILQFADVAGALSCPSTSLEAPCATSWSGQLAMLPAAVDFDSTEPGAEGTDAGMDGGRTTSPSGCGCRVAPPGAPRLALAAWLVIACTARRRRASAGG